MLAIRVPGLRAPLNRSHFRVVWDRLRGTPSASERQLQPFAELDALVAARVVHGRLDPFVEAGGPPEDDPAHLLMRRFNDQLRAQSEGNLLEIGARARSGINRRDLTPPGWSYTGLDVREGPNVDVVGDAHQISRLFEPEYFDAVVAYAVLEHIMMPWKFVLELNKVLKIGAMGMFCTVHSWPLHDAPWDFWRFSDEAWKSLLNRATGFEISEAKLGEPLYMVAKRVHSVTNFRDSPGYGLSCVSFRKIGQTKLEWPVEVCDITQTQYPAHQV